METDATEALEENLMDEKPEFKDEPKTEEEVQASKNEIVSEETNEGSLSNSVGRQ